MKYTEFLKSKVKLAEQFGFDIHDHDVNPILRGAADSRVPLDWRVRR